MLARLDRLRVCWRKSSVVQSSTATPTTGQVSRLIAAHRRSVSWRGNRRLAQDLALFTQVPVLAAQPAEFVTLGRGEAIVAAAGIQVGALDPLLARGLGQLQFLGDLADRLAGRADQLNDLGLVLRRKNRRGRSIGLHLKGQALILGVHQPGSTPGSSWRARWVIVVAVMVAPACRSSAERCCKFVAGSARPRRRVLPPLSPRSDDVQPRRSTHYGVVGGREEEYEGGGAGGGGPGRLRGLGVACEQRRQRGATGRAAGSSSRPSHGDWMRGLCANGFAVKASTSDAPRRTHRPLSHDLGPVGPQAAEWRTSKPRTSH